MGKRNEVYSDTVDCIGRIENGGDGSDGKRDFIFRADCPSRCSERQSRIAV